MKLPVKMNLHIDNLTNSKPGGTDRQSVLDFYDSFPMNPKYAMIEPKHFKKKPLRVKRTKDRLARLASEDFGTLEDELDESSSDEDDNAAGQGASY